LSILFFISAAVRPDFADVDEEEVGDLEQKT
jgi:hypothetical protein